MSHCRKNDNVIADAQRTAKVDHKNLPNLAFLCWIHRRIWWTSEQLGKFVRIRHRPDDTKPRQTVRVAEDGIVTLLIATVSAPDLPSSINTNAATQLNRQHVAVSTVGKTYHLLHCS